MYRIDDPSASTTLPTPEAALTEGFWTEGNPGSGIPATLERASWFNMIQEELRNIVLAGGLTPSKTTYTQVRDAINALRQTGTTPAQFDNSTKVATTEFLARFGLQFSPFHSGQVTAASTVLDASYAGSRIYFNNTVNQSATLPPGAGLPNGFAMHFSKGSTGGTFGTLTINSGAGNIIDSGEALVSSIVIQAGEDCILVWNSSAGTWLSSGTYLFRFVQFTTGQSTGGNGVQPLPGGWSLQRGSGSATTSTSTVTLPVAARTAIRMVLITSNDPSATNTTCVASIGASLTSFSVRASASTAFTWLAITD